MFKLRLESPAYLPFPPRRKDTIMFDHLLRTLAQEYNLVYYMEEAPRRNTKHWPQRETVNTQVSIDAAASTSSAFMGIYALVSGSKVVLFQFLHSVRLPRVQTNSCLKLYY